MSLVSRAPCSDAVMDDLLPMKRQRASALKAKETMTAPLAPLHVAVPVKPPPPKVELCCSELDAEADDLDLDEQAYEAAW